VAGHRLFIVFLYAVYLTAMCRIATTVLDLSWKYAFVAGVLIMTARHNVYHYVWITEGMHLLKACLFVFSVIFLLRWLKRFFL
jgi:hypothetical protein